MTRIPPLRRELAESDQGALFDELVADRGTVILDHEGYLTGPLGVWIYSPNVERRLMPLHHLKAEVALDARSVELAILVTTARWRAEFPFCSHSQSAQDCDIPDHVIDAIAEGRAPSLDSVRDRTVYQVARKIVTDGVLDDDTLAACRRALGDRETVELVVVCGFYTLASYSVNVADVVLPVGASPRWSGAAASAVDDEVAPDLDHHSRGHDGQSGGGAAGA